MYDDLPSLMDLCGVSITALPDGITVGIIDIDRMKNHYFADTISAAEIPPDRFTGIFEEWGITPGSKFGSFRTFKRQTEWASGRIAFSAIDRSFLGGGHGISHIEGGAPVIEGLVNPVSITHSGKYAAAAVSINADIALGIDLERLRSFENRESFLRVAFPEEDPSRMDALSDSDIIRMWTLKESFLKIVQLGFAENLGNVRIDQDCFTYKGTRIDSLKRETIEFDGHILSVVWGEIPSKRG